MAGAPPPKVPSVRARGRWPRRAPAGLAMAGALLLAAPVGGVQQSGTRQGPRSQQPLDVGAREQRAEGGVIIGTVIDSDTGRGLPRARVTLTGPAGPFAIATDPLGRYYFVALPDGDYEIAAEAPGYASGRFGRLRAGGPAQRLTLARNEWRVDANIAMWRLGAIEGVVLDEFGEGIAGMRVHALRREHGDAGPVITDIETAVTDDRGAFRIAALVPGHYLVMTPSVQVTVPLVMTSIAQTGRGGGGITALLGIFDARGPDEPGSGRFAAENLVPLSEDFASLRGRVAEPPPPGEDGVPYVYPTQYYSSTELPSLATAIDLEPGMQFFNAGFELRPVPARTVQGVVMGPAGPTSNQLLRLVPDTGEDFGAGFEVARTISNLEGEFTFLDVPAGRYVLEVRDVESFNQLSPRPFVPAGAVPRAGADAEPIPRRPDQRWARIPINVFNEDVEDLTVTLQPTRSIIGQVRFQTTGAPPRPTEVGEIRVSLKPAGGGRAGVRAARTSATGGFALDGLWPRSYYVDLVLPSGWSVASIEGQGRDLTTLPLDASMGSADVAVTVRLTDAQTLLRGTVRDASGRTVDDRIVVVVPADTRARPPLRTREVRVASTGEYFVSGLPPGRYQVMALSGDEAARWREPGGPGRMAARAHVVTLGAGGQRVQDLRVGR